MPRPRQNCPAEYTLRVVGGTWKVPILFHLARAGGPLRFSALRRVLVGVSQKVLTQQLRELEGAGAVSRKVFAEVPPRVEYDLTDLGRSLLPVVNAMVDWGKAHVRQAAACSTEAPARRPAPAGPKERR